MRNRIRMMAAGAALTMGLSIAFAATPKSAEAGWKWVNRNGDCVDSCSRDDCPCYSWVQPPAEQ